MEYYSAFLLQLNMEPCFSADTPTFIWYTYKTAFPHLYMALFPQIIITPLSGTYSFFTIPPLYDTIFYILRGYYPTFICGFTAAPVPTFIWHFFITSHAGTCSAEGLFTPTFTCNLYSPSAFILFHLNVSLPQGFSAEYFYPL